MRQLDPVLVVALPRSLPLCYCQKTSVIKLETLFVNPLFIYSVKYNHMCIRTPRAQDKLCLWATNLL